MILAVPAHTQPSGFDSGEAEPDRLAQCRGVDVRNPVLVADPPVRKVQALPRHVPVGVGRVVCGKPARPNVPAPQGRRVGPSEAPPGMEDGAMHGGTGGQWIDGAVQ